MTGEEWNDVSDRKTVSLVSLGHAWLSPAPREPNWRVATRVRIANRIELQVTDRRCRIGLIRAPARVLPVVPGILAGVASIIAMVATVITAVHSAATGERAQHGGEACEKREARHRILRCGVCLGCIHGFVFFCVGFANFRKGSGKGLILSRTPPP